MAATDLHAPGPAPAGVDHPLGPGAVFAERYRLVRRLGQGGMAEVYEVEHALTRRHLALKLLRPEVLGNAASVERFYREASVCAGIDSDHIVSVVDCDVDKPSGVPFLVMELLQGKDLAQYLAETTAAGAALPPALVLQLMKQVASALDKVHAQGIVHRDLKPANLFLTFPSDGPPRVKILDFGIAALAHEDQPATANKLGTPLYMAPEQLLSGATISRAADLYALALIVYELLVGAPYWEGNTAASLFAKIPDRAARPKPSERALARHVALPEAFDAWLLRCIDPDPARRPASAGAAVGDLLMVFDPTATHPPRPGALAPAARVGPIAPRPPLDAPPRAAAGGTLRRPVGAPVVPARGPGHGPARRLSPLPARPVAIPSPAPPPPQDAPPSTPPSIPPPPLPPSALEDDAALHADDLEDLRSTGVVSAVVAPAGVASVAVAAAGAAPWGVAPPPPEAPAPALAAPPPRVLDDGLSERATRRIVSRLKAPVAPEALTQRLEPVPRADEALTQRLVPVIPPPPPAEPEEVILAVSRAAAPRFDAPPAMASPHAFDDGDLPPPEEIVFDDSAATGLEASAEEAAAPHAARPHGLRPPDAEAAAQAPAEAPPDAGQNLSAKVDAAMSDAAPRVRRRIPRAVELASTAILPAPPPPRTVRRSTLGLATAGTVLLAALAGWVLFRDNARRPMTAADAWQAPTPAEQAALGRSVQGLAATLRGRRSARGYGHTGDPATATGLDTGRGLAALLGAHRAGHSAMTPQDQLDTLVALDRLRGDHGWSALRDGALVPTAEATAWAALAYASMSEMTQAETARVRVRVARAALLRSQTDDGGFPLHADGPAQPESTVVATWALVMAEPQDPTTAAAVRAATRRALVRVRALLDTSPSPSWTPRHEALAVLCLARARAALRLADASDDARFARFARGLVTRCALPTTGNARCAAAADAPAPRPAWWPWSMAATAVLLRGESRSLDPATRQALGAMLRAELAAFDSNRAAWQALPTAELSEALLAFSEMTL